MNKRIRKFSLVAAVAIVLSVALFSGTRTVSAHDDDKKYEISGIKLGGLLYDKWYKVLDVEVTGNHPLYPANGKKSGGDTWRCKECHGWDYVGKDGRYSKGSHYTGIAGITSASGKSARELTRALSGGIEGHDFAALMKSHDNVEALVRFVREGLVDMGSAIDGQGRGTGDAKNGKALFGKNCSSCHGEDGNALDFKGKDDGIQGVGWLANDNPQETLHKLRWGHPGTGMPSAVADGGLSDSAAVDLLTYSQTLK